MKKKEHEWIRLIFIFLKIGFIGFGGGSALIPVIQSEIKNLKGGIGKEELDKDVVAASITPGALPVEIAAGVGEAFSGIGGMWLSAVSMALPGVVMTVLFLIIFSASSADVINYIGFAAVGVNMFILVIITGYIAEAVRRFESNRKVHAALMIFAVFFLNAWMEVSTISILMAAFFAILYTEGNFRTYKMFIAATLSALYLFGSTGLYPGYAQHAIKIVMAILAAWGVFDTFRKTENLEILDKGRLKLLAKEVGVWVATMIIFCIPAMLITSDMLEYVVKGMWSSLISFGGGDAYLSIADGIFVASGMVGSQVFYRQIVPAANALPGSILCKILSGVGFIIGYGLHGRTVEGLAVALAGFGISVSMSCLVFMLVRYIYECFESWHIFQMLKRWIGTMIAGLLMTVGVTILRDNMEFMETTGMPAASIIILCAGIYLSNLILERGTRVGSLLRILVSAAIALTYCICLG